LDILKCTKVSQLLCTNGKITSIFSESTVESGLVKMKKHDFLSLPIIDSETTQFRGFVDALDLSTYVIAKSNSDWNFEKIASHPIGHVLNYSKQDPTCVLDNTASLFDALEILSKSIQRIAIVDKTETGLLLNIITQSALVQFISKNLCGIPTKHLKTPISLCSLYDRVISISCDILAIDALRKMREQKVTAAAIIDGQKLVGSIGCSDLRGLTLDLFDAMKILSIMDFLLRLNPDKTLPVVSKDTSLETIIMKFSCCKSHRIFIVDDLESMTLESVVSLTDVLQLLKSSSI